MGAAISGAWEDLSRDSMVEDLGNGVGFTGEFQLCIPSPLRPQIPPPPHMCVYVCGEVHVCVGVYPCVHVCN